MEAQAQPQVEAPKEPVNHLQSAVDKIASGRKFDLTPEEQEKVENMVFAHKKPIGICECNGKGKEKCKGNGWIRDGQGYQKCPYFISSE